MEETFHEKINKSLTEITDKKVLIVKCNDCIERSALF